jgi:hypothetical protein
LGLAAFAGVDPGLLDAFRDYCDGVCNARWGADDHAIPLTLSSRPALLEHLIVV